MLNVILNKHIIYIFFNLTQLYLPSIKFLIKQKSISFFFQYLVRLVKKKSHTQVQTIFSQKLGQGHHQIFRSMIFF